MRHANNYNVWINHTDLFPHPYTTEDADRWLARCAQPSKSTVNCAIEYCGDAIGGVGFTQMTDVHRRTAEIGYWVAEPFWGRGIATMALEEMTARAFANPEIHRIQAHVFEWNPASARVLEKAGYYLEARFRRYIVKNGRTGDSLLYVRLREP